MTAAMTPDALDGVRVLDFTQMMLGPLCTQTLADLGADVVKVERPGVGEWMRKMPMLGEFVGRDSAAFHSFNRNKRSVAVDLKHPDGRALLLEIVKDFDVVTENFRAGVMDRLGLGYEDFKAVKPDIIYASGSGWGQNSELAKQNWPGQDLLIQAMSGVMYNTGRATDQPTACGTPIADFAASQAMVSGILAALLARARHGLGQRVEVDLYSATLNLMAQENFAVLNQDLTLERSSAGVATPWNDAPYGPHPTSDGYVAIAMCPLDKLAILLDDPGIAGMHGFRDRDVLKLRIDGHSAKMTTAALLKLLQSADVWCAPVRDSREAMDELVETGSDLLVDLDHPEAGVVKAIACPITLTGTPATRKDPAPLVGQHTDEVLQELIGGARCSALKEKGAIG
ncbi:CoA transferase [Rhodophyticola sp. CCM32]|uniref:CaiB/BaiF CoA transferase family protein n=1 Tax=Rhodophyticola sp. CCM32 TaxID=2916397 RepID=UPI00107F97F3|nr:CaiB/BaiF CoA-transferase family protein [Rhodophyticola sp. CCM32]QBY01337.1 CoA transferase [Rhodophyticola sp. CCM32]